MLALLLDPAAADVGSPASLTEVQALQAEVDRLEQRLEEISAQG